MRGQDELRVDMTWMEATASRLRRNHNRENNRKVCWKLVSAGLNGKFMKSFIIYRFFVCFFSSDSRKILNKLCRTTTRKRDVNGQTEREQTWFSSSFFWNNAVPKISSNKFVRRQKCLGKSNIFQVFLLFSKNAFILFKEMGI